MNFRKSITEAEQQFQIAPMIDVIFVLLTFFVAVFGMQQNEREIEIKPPVSYSGSAVDRNPYDIMINVREDGTLIVNRKKWTLIELRDRLRMLSSSSNGETMVLIRADAMTVHQNVVNVIDACTGANINRFSFITVEQDMDAKHAAAMRGLGNPEARGR